jgi:hypothetical protein
MEAVPSEPQIQRIQYTLAQSFGLSSHLIDFSKYCWIFKNGTSLLRDLSLSIQKVFEGQKVELMDVDG